MGNQMENKMADDMETEFYKGFLGIRTSLEIS